SPPGSAASSRHRPRPAPDRAGWCWRARYAGRKGRPSGCPPHPASGARYRSCRTSPSSGFLFHYRPDTVTREHPREIAFLADREDHDRNAVVAAQGHGGGVHHLEIVGQNPVVTDRIETLCLRVLLRIGVVDPIHTRALE